MQYTSDNLGFTSREDYLLKILENAPVGILTFTADWEIDFVNENYTKYGILYNIDSFSLRGLNILEQDLFPGIDIKKELKELREGYSFEKEIKNIPVSGRGYISLFIKASPVFADGQFNGGILIIEDIKTIGYSEEDDIHFGAHLDKIANSLYDIFLIVDKERRIKYISGRGLEEIFPAVQSVIDKQLAILFTTDNLNKILEGISSAIERRSSVEMNLEIKTAGKRMFYKCSIFPYQTKYRQIKFIYLFFENNTELLNELNHLKNEINRLDANNAAALSIPQPIITTNNEGEIKYFNQEAKKCFNLSDGTYNMFLGDIIGNFDRPYFNKIKTELDNYRYWKTSLSVFKENKQKETYEVKFALTDNHNHPIIITCTDITDRTVSENKLKSSEETLRAIINQAGELICSVDISGDIIYANNTFCEKLGYTPEEIIDQNITKFIDPDYLSSNVFEIGLFDQSKTKIELPLSTKKGESIPSLAYFTSSAVEKSGKKIYSVYFIDISDKYQINKKLELYNGLIESASDGIVLLNQGKIVMCNDSFSQIFGFKGKSDLVGQQMLDLISNDDILKVAEYIQLLETGRNAAGRFEFLGRRKNSSQFFTEVTAATFLQDKKTYIVFVTRDVTERKRAQQAIRESEEKYRNITENIDDFLYTFERTGRILRPVFYTSSVEKITGYSQAEFLIDSRLILKIIHPDDFEAAKKFLKKLLKSTVQNSGEFELRIIHKNGNIVWIRNKINLIRSRDGLISKVYGLISDITLRKKAQDELKKSTDNLIKLNETKDRFISIISHDLRTPFSSILGFTDLLLHDEGLNEEEKRQYIEFIRESSQSMLLLVNSLLDWTRIQTGRIKFEPEKTDAGKIIENSINTLIGTAIQKNIQITSEVPNELLIFADKGLLLQVFNNLISNSIKFTRPGGSIIISCRPSRQIRFYEFSVKDTGTGIKKENLDKLFNVDTKFSSEGTAGEKGTGLGLSLVKEIIEKHGGEISVKSEYGMGSDFVFTIPVGSSVILLVDDSKTDRLLYSKILKNITPDYNIDIASNGKEAIEKILEYPPAIVITDHKMPIMNGYEFVKELKKLEMKGKPPVMVLSSNIDRQIILDYNDLGIEYVFQKPVNLSNFKQAVEKTIRKGIAGS
ncbi:MAG TPA: PAS domain S-box protein [Ignavibacteriaceae bacterium]|nr:PAS domain S-box protein [Ignavibacteriaceae bacterium]